MAVIAVALATIAAPAIVYAAPQVTVSKSCYRGSRGIDLAGSGFTPSSAVSASIAYAGQTLTYALVSDAAGNIAVNVQAPAVEGRPAAVLTAVDATLAAQGRPPEEYAASVSFTLTAWRIRAFGIARVSSPRFKTRFIASGWAHVPGEALYAHYVRGGRRIATRGVGLLDLPCGDLDARIWQPRLRAGTYTIYLDASPVWPNQVEGLVFRNIRIRGR